EHFVPFIKSDVLPLQDITETQSLDAALHAVLSGDTALFVDGAGQALIIGSKGWKSRPVEEPQTEALIRGPRDGFNEDLRTNTATIRRRIKDPRLRFESYQLGERSKKDVVVAYIEGI